MLIKWIFNILLLVWLYTVIVRPLLQGYFGAPKRPNQGSSPRARHDDTASGKVIIQPKSKTNNKDDDGDYIDFEEVK